jgi:hypothetical protein
MEIRAFAVLDIPFIIVVYLAVLMFVRAPRTVVLPSLLGGLVMGLINLLVDIAAYYTHLWHYTLSGLTWHVPLPFYITPVLIYGSVAYLLIWRFWKGPVQWLARVALIGVPLFGIFRDIMSALSNSTYVPRWDSPLAIPVDILMWAVMFYAGYWIFTRLAPTYEAAELQRREEELLALHTDMVTDEDDDDGDDDDSDDDDDDSDDVTKDVEHAPSMNGHKHVRLP